MHNVTKENNSKKARNGLTHRNKLGYFDPSIAGIDIGADLIHVAIPNSSGTTDVSEFGTTTPALHNIAESLKKAGVTTAVMEATGVYWIPLFEILEEKGFIAILVDAKSLKNVPGRNKTDVRDSQWIQTCYSCGLLRAAFRPLKDKLPLRQYVRQRQSDIKMRQRALLHMEKALQLMNIKLSGALSDIGGISGMDIIRAIVRGERDAAKLANLRNQRCKKSQEVFIDSLTGNFQKEHVFSLTQALELYDFSEKQINDCDQRIKAELEKLPTITNEPLPKREKDKKPNGKYKKAQKPRKNNLSFGVRELLWKKSGIDATALDGIEENSALTLFSEVGGIDMSAWETDKNFASWLKLCPGNNISGGRRRKSKKQPCANYISQTFRMAALSAKKSDSALGARIRSISGKEEKAKGIKAGAHRLAKLYYNMCKFGWEYHRKGAAEYEKEYRERRLRSVKRNAYSMGYVLVPIEKAA